MKLRLLYGSLDADGERWSLEHDLIIMLHFDLVDLFDLCMQRQTDPCAVLWVMSPH